MSTSRRHSSTALAVLLAAVALVFGAPAGVAAESGAAPAFGVAGSPLAGDLGGGVHARAAALTSVADAVLLTDRDRGQLQRLVPKRSTADVLAPGAASLGRSGLAVLLALAGLLAASLHARRSRRTHAGLCTRAPPAVS